MSHKKGEKGLKKRGNLAGNDIQIHYLACRLSSVRCTVTAHGSEDTLRESSKCIFFVRYRNNDKKTGKKKREIQPRLEKTQIFYYLIGPIVSFFLHPRGISVVFFRHSDRSSFTATFSDGFFILDMTVTFATVEPRSFARIRIIREKQACTKKAFNIWVSH